MEDCKQKTNTTTTRTDDNKAVMIIFLLIPSIIEAGADPSGLLAADKIAHC
jgi:hypothetical protein